MSVRCKTGWARVVIAVMIVCSLHGASAAAEPSADVNGRWQGEYAFVQTRVCVQNAQGFTPELVLLGPATTRTSALQGSFTLDGGGGGSYRVDDLQLNHNVTTTGSRQTGRTTSECNVSYSVEEDGSIRLALTDCFGTGLIGAVEGFTFTSTTQDLVAHPSKDGQTLLLSSVEPNVDDTVTTVETGAIAKRICSRTGTAVRVR